MNKTDHTVIEHAPTEAATGRAADSALTLDSTDGLRGQGRAVTEPALSTDRSHAVPDWPHDWRTKLAGGDKKLAKRFERMDSPLDVVKSWRSMEQRLSTGELRATPSRDVSDEERAQWRRDIGVPETPDGYLDYLPDGLVIGSADKPMLKDFLNDMHLAGASPALVAESIAWYFRNREHVAASRAQADLRFRAQADAALRDDWGPEYRPNLAAVHAMLNQHAPQHLTERLFAARMADGRALGDDPDVLRLLVALAREINPRGTVVPSAGGDALKSLEDQISTYEKRMREDRAGWFADDGARAHYRQLIQVRQKIRT